MPERRSIAALSHYGLAETVDRAMAAVKKLLAFDLGAESGRGVVGLFDGFRLTLDEIHRFPNGGVRTLDTLHWDVLRLYGELLAGMGRAVARHGSIDSLGVDTWGVDFALLGRDDILLGNPRHYRDSYTDGILEEAFAQMPRRDIFRQTGVQFLRINTLCQLLALRRAASPLLEATQTLLFMPDLFHFWLTGLKVNEVTNASTSQMLDAFTREWASDLVEVLDLPRHILGHLVPAGTVLGPLQTGIASETSLGPALVIAPATHDTGSAVAAVPASGMSWAFLSSGTWSLMGVELAEPLINEDVLRHNFTNEAGVGGTVRFLKNIMGLWLVQECRREWAHSGSPHAYDELTHLAQAVPAFRSLVNPDDASFLLPPNMPAALAEFCRRTDQPVPTGLGEFVRCALESLALRYRWTLDRLEELIGRRLEVIHVVGGGCQNTLLCQWTADACDRAVLAGPVEATAAGNVLVQAMGLRLLGTLAEVREVVRQSFDLRPYTPHDPERWRGPYARFQGYLEQNP